MKNELKITSPDKILFPKDKITKMDLIDYYIEVAPHMMPYIENRLLSVIRCHDNIKGECFFKKHPTTEKNSVCVYKEKGEEYFYLKEMSQLVNQVQNGTIEFHTGGSKVDKINRPNVMVFDLDPEKNLSLEKLRECVLKVKSVLDKLKLKSFLKTSGGKGYHIVLPFKECKDWESFYNFSHQIALLLESKWPNDFTTNIKKSERKGKVFIDYLRNNRGSTCVAPYSVRARDGAPISMPISWKDLYKIKPNEITIKNFKEYINKSWKKFFKVKQIIK